MSSPNPESFQVRILTVSDRGAAGVRADRSGPALAEHLRERGYRVLGVELVADGVESVADRLVALCEAGDAQLVLTTGGSGLGPRDWTPEATARIGDREVPGLMELARRRCSEITAFAALGRGRCVSRGKTLILNLPGNPKAAVETFDAIAELLPHALQIVSAAPADCDITGTKAAASSSKDS